MSEVHRGLHGVAYTVFEGTQPEAMDVEILGVLKNVLGPDQDMILARLHGSKPEYTGVVAGMSGSPVYVDGKLLGALSYRIGQFSKEPIAGITPIAEMLAVNGTAEPEVMRAGTRSAAMWMPQTESPAAATADATDIHPIETPLLLSGFSPEAVRFFQEHVSVMGLTPVAGLGGNASDGTHMDSSSPLLPGSAVSALLVRGDLEIAATCTVTYVDPHQVLACGHPITRYGNVSIPMTKADVVTTLASPLNSFKIVNTTQTIGAFTEDRSSAIRGVPGESAHMIPVAIHTHGSLHDRTLHMEVVDNPDITPGAVMVSLYESLLETNSYSEELTYELRGTVAIDGYPLLHLDSLIAPTEQLPSALRAALTVGQRFQAVYGNSARVRNIQRIDLDIDSLPGRRSIQLGASPGNATDGPSRRHGHGGGDTAAVSWRNQKSSHPHSASPDVESRAIADPAQRWSHPRPADQLLILNRSAPGIDQHHPPDERGTSGRPLVCNPPVAQRAGSGRWANPGVDSHLHG